MPGGRWRLPAGGASGDSAAPLPTPSAPPLPTPSPAFTCAPGLVPARIWPSARDETKVRVLDASGRSGLGASVGNDLRNPAWGFQVVEVRETTEPLDAVAVLRAGPSAYGNAYFMQPLFYDDARVEFDLARDDDVVDVVIGTRFRTLPSVTQVNQMTAGLEKPTPPRGT